jgi:hypothetical protein
VYRLGILSAPAPPHAMLQDLPHARAGHSARVPELAP